MVEFFSYVLFAFAAEHFASSASAFAFSKFGIVFFKEEQVVLENAADCWVSARFPLFGCCAFASCESVPNLLFHDVGWIHGEYAGFWHAGAHFSACA